MTVWHHKIWIRNGDDGPNSDLVLIAEGPLNSKIVYVVAKPR